MVPPLGEPLRRGLNKKGRRLPFLCPLPSLRARRNTLRRESKARAPPPAHGACGALGAATDVDLETAESFSRIFLPLLFVGAKKLAVDLSLRLVAEKFDRPLSPHATLQLTALCAIRNLTTRGEEARKHFENYL